MKKRERDRDRETETETETTERQREMKRMTSKNYHYFKNRAHCKLFSRDFQFSVVVSPQDTLPKPLTV